MKVPPNLQPPHKLVLVGRFSSISLLSKKVPIFTSFSSHPFFLHNFTSIPSMAATFPFSSPILSSSPITSTRSSAIFPNYSALKLTPIAATRFAASPTSRIAPRNSRLVCKAQDTALEVAAITDAKWQSLVLESECTVLVEFWAPWCGPCRMIHPIIDELAKDYVGKVKFYKLNTDESRSTATRYGIRSIPTVMIFKNGEKKDTVVGAVPKSTLTTSIEKFL